jgi:hypothetical protein
VEVGEQVSIVITGDLEDESPFRGEDIIRVISHEDTLTYSNLFFNYPLFSVKTLILQLTSLVGFAVIIVILASKRKNILKSNYFFFILRFHNLKYILASKSASI